MQSIDYQRSSTHWSVRITTNHLKKPNCCSYFISMLHLRIDFSIAGTSWLCLERKARLWIIFQHSWGARRYQRGTAWEVSHMKACLWTDYSRPRLDFFRITRFLNELWCYWVFWKPFVLNFLSIWSWIRSITVSCVWNFEKFVGITSECLQLVLRYWLQNAIEVSSMCLIHEGQISSKGTMLVCKVVETEKNMSFMWCAVFF